MPSNSLRAFADTAIDAFCAPQSRDKAPRDLAILNSARLRHVAHRQILEIPPDLAREPIALAVYEWGEQGQPAVALVHGWELQAGRMGHSVGPLLRAGFRVIAIDLPAHGASGGSLLNVPDGAAAIADACAACGGVTALIGHSFGGLAALWLAAHAIGDSLSHVVTLGSGSSVNFLIRNLAAAKGWDADHEHAFRDRFAERFGGPVEAYSVAGFGRHIRVPVLVVHDKRDNMVGFEESDAILEHVPTARRVATSGLGHRAITRDAEVIAAAIRFIQTPATA
ncbi:MAG: alpha/beta fold hydrolase [Thermoflexales bacterium]